MKEVIVRNDSDKVSKVRSIILSAGNKLASVHFRKRSDNSKRRMSFRLHVSRPSYAKAPGKKDKKRFRKNLANDQLVVYDCNKICYTKNGYMTRGAYRTIPLERVERICVNGEIYKIRSK